MNTNEETPTKDAASGLTSGQRGAWDAFAQRPMTDEERQSLDEFMNAPTPAPATSETPRTDEQWERHDHETIDEASARCRHFARTLERELTAAKRVRDEANARLVNSIKHLNRLGSWAQQDPTGPFESVQIQQWVLSELRAALGQDYEPTKWQPSILMLRDQLSAATRRAEEAERERDEWKAQAEHQSAIAKQGLVVVGEAANELNALRSTLRQVQAERDEAQQIVCSAYSRVASFLHWAQPHPMQINIAKGSLLRSIEAIISKTKS